MKFFVTRAVSPLNTRVRKHCGGVRTAAWLWAMVMLLLLKLAAPGLASVAAQQRGVELVEVCSVYGMRTVALQTNLPGVLPSQALLNPTSPSQNPSNPDPQPTPMGSHTQEHECALTSLITTAVIDTTPFAVLLLHLSQQHFTRLKPDHDWAPPDDAPLRWLTGQLHAPPALI
jgi:hypothetical protein